MQLKKLTPDFYANNYHLKEALDNYNSNWESGKTRGYGIVVINVNSLTFAIPLRSNIRHKSAFFTGKNKGLDLSKSLLISDPGHISSEVFKIPPHEHHRLLNQDFFIQNKFEKYVEKYANARSKNDRFVLTNQEYRYTTLINYHIELGIED